MGRSVLHLGCVCALVALPVGGCSDESTGTGGGGGTGDSGGDGGTGAMGGAGGGGMPECETADNCLDDFNECTANACTDDMCTYPMLENGTPCDEDNECTTDGACAEGECVTTPLADGTACADGAGTCQSGSCSGTFACTEAGILDAIAVGGGPHTFDCDGPTTVVIGADIRIDSDVELDGGGNLIIDGDRRHNVSVNAVVTLRRIAMLRGDHGGAQTVGQCIFNEGSLLLVESMVSECGVLGGALSNTNGELTVMRSVVSDSPSTEGVIVLSGRTRIVESTISGNQVGIAVPLGDPQVIVANSTISGNVRLGIGGDSRTTVVNSTVVGGNAVAGAVTLRGTLVRGGCAEEVVSGGYNVEVSGDGCGFDQQTDQANVSLTDVKLGELADNGGPTMTHALLPGSVAIDVIPEEDCVDADGQPLTTDQRGEPRPETGGTMCDIGAFEVQP